MVEILESDYVEMARLKGLPERRVLWRHAVPNALAPTIQVTALNLAYLAGGIVVVESVFDYPGIGLLLVDAVARATCPSCRRSRSSSRRCTSSSTSSPTSPRSSSARGCGPRFDDDGRGP